MATLEKDIARLRGEISKRKQEILDLDAKAAQLAASDPEASLTADTRARGVERLLQRIHPELTALVERKADADLAKAKAEIEAEHVATGQQITAQIGEVDPLVAAFVGSFRAMMANRYGKSLVLQLLPDLQGEKYIAVMLANFEQVAPKAQESYARDALSAADTRAQKLQAAKSRINAECAALLAEDDPAAQTAPMNQPALAAAN